MFHFYLLRITVTLAHNLTITTSDPAVSKCRKDTDSSVPLSLGLRLFSVLTGVTSVLDGGYSVLD